MFSLPWQGLKAATKKQKYDKICQKKLSTPIEVDVLGIYLCCECLSPQKIMIIFLLFPKGTMQISSCRVCFILPLLPFFDVWSTTWLWIFEAPISGSICSRRWFFFFPFFNQMNCTILFICFWNSFFGHGHYYQPLYIKSESPNLLPLSMCCVVSFTSRISFFVF